MKTKYTMIRWLTNRNRRQRNWNSVHETPSLVSNLPITWLRWRGFSTKSYGVHWRTWVWGSSGVWSWVLKESESSSIDTHNDRRWFLGCCLLWIEKARAKGVFICSRIKKGNRSFICFLLFIWSRIRRRPEGNQPFFFLMSSSEEHGNSRKQHKGRALSEIHAYDRAAGSSCCAYAHPAALL